MTALRQIRHLVTRFFGVVTGDPLGPGAQVEVNEILEPAAAALFWEQDSIDQQHAFEVAQRVRAGLGFDRTALAASLLHDVGKRHCDVGPIGRSLATVFDAVHLPMPDGWRRYRDHGALGAADLEAIGASTLAVSFARGDIAPADGIDEDVWNVLVAADDA